MTDIESFPGSQVSLTRERLADRLSRLSGFTRKECLNFVSDFLDEVLQSLERNEVVKIPGLGTFKLRDKGARPGQNPSTGETVNIDPRRVVTFHAGKKLRDRIAANSEYRRAERAPENSD